MASGPEGTILSAGGEQAGDRIGPYRLLEQVGEGGFGVVWLVERREPMVQRLALKVVKPGMDSRAVVARFEQERQALAVMDHPNVARVTMGGAWFLGLAIVFAPLPYAHAHVRPTHGWGIVVLSVLSVLLASPLLIARAIRVGRMRTYAVTALAVVSSVLLEQATIAYRDFWFAQHARAELTEQLEREQLSEQDPSLQVPSDRVDP